MPWRHDAESRRRSAKTYGPQWRKIRQAALNRAGGKCEKCGARGRVQVDHITPVSQGGTHSLGNLQVLCLPCHRVKTAGEGGGYRKPKGAADPDVEQRTAW